MSSLGGSQVLSHTGITASVTCVHTKECACYVDSPDTLAWGPVVALYVIFFGFHNNYTGKSRHACVCVHAPSPGRLPSRCRNDQSVWSYVVVDCFVCVGDRRFRPLRDIS